MGKQQVNRLKSFLSDSSKEIIIYDSKIEYGTRKKNRDQIVVKSKKSCPKETEIMEWGMEMAQIRVECRYCDNPCKPRNVDGDLVCSNCGAEWASAKCEIKVSDQELERERKEQEEYDQWMEQYGEDY